MNLEITPHSDGFGAYTDHMFSLDDLRALGAPGGEVLSAQIAQFGFLEAQVPLGLYIPAATFGSARRRQSAFVHRDGRLRAIIDACQGREEGTYLLRPDVYREAQKAGLEALWPFISDETMFKKLDGYFHSLSLRDPQPNLLVQIPFAAHPSMTTVAIGTYQAAVIKAANGAVKRISWGGAANPGAVKMVIVSPSTPHFREVDPKQAFPDQDGIDVFDIRESHTFSHHRS